MLLKNLILVGMGGMAGSLLRYACSLLLRPGSFPWATFTVNIAGSLLIGLLMGYGSRNNSSGQDLQLLLVTGFCGGFTTFSAFSADNLLLLKDGRMGMFVLYAGASVLLGLLATYVGYRIAAIQQ
jgi:fluoride exporter